MREEARLLWEQALEDLKTAEALITVKRYYASVFFSQQGEENTLKALYIELKREFPPKTHSLLRLSNELGIEDEEVIDAVLDLNPEYIVTRYPDAANEVPARIYNERMAISHLKKSKKVIEFCRKRIGEESSEK
ncbi:HEPN domain-containing protein [Thermococcus stetteri]|uniref:HEPN domain-containing protein n=1 Tax=Thermococcus stetteri TaxID=49900 RepID=UPI001AE13515|nr:HEPN domain-containing protein [Thermococcus stetteri]MBP1911270.1 HEPN domain-containing protein [Thermococcus stetteri]